MLEIIRKRGVARFLQAHDGVSAVIADHAKIKSREFDGLWSSSFVDSLRLCRPDMEVADVTLRLQGLQPIIDASRKPILFDGDTGGLDHQFHYMVRSLEKAGVAGVAIEDKIGKKRNSMLGSGADQRLLDPAVFIRKLKAGLEARQTSTFCIFARIESLVVGAGLQDALERSEAYLSAGAHGVVVQSASSDPGEMLSFAKEFRRRDPVSPLAAVPTTYGSVTETELSEAGVTMLGYANQLMRAAHAAMVRAATDLLTYQQSSSVDSYSTSVSELLDLFPEPV